jgi:hypothetical protein
MRFVAIILFVSLWISCTPKLQLQYNTQKTICIGATQDNQQYVKAWGIGDNYERRLVSAKKNAVSDIIFSGLIGGNSGCETKPIVSEVNAKERYRDFFDSFFSDNGDFSKFITNSKTLNKMNFEKGRGGDFVVNVYDLRMYLISNKIISK